MYCLHCMAKLPDGAKECDRCHRAVDAQSASHHLSAGTVLNGHYLIGDAIGEGGFGITYIGLDLNLDLRVAVKEFYPYGSANRNNSVSNDVYLNYPKDSDLFTDVKNRFLREAKDIAKFSKEPSIVDVRDYFTENNTAYIVMEYIDGVTLADHLDRHGAFEPDRIFSLMAPVMAALNKIHREGIIHRDISPENIMMTAAGDLILMDFGSARFYSGENKRTMSVVLKPGYAPFEQYSADGDQGPWTDVYALSATLYKCVTGVTPPDAMARCQSDTLKPPSELGVSLSPEQERALELGLKIYSGDRLRSIDEFTAVLSGKEPAREKGIRALITKRRASRRFSRTYGDTFTRYDESRGAQKQEQFSLLPVFIAVLIFVVAVGGLSLAFLLHPDTEKKQAAEETAAPTETTVRATEARITMPDVTGKEIDSASKILTDLGLVVETQEEESAVVEKGFVIRQSVTRSQQLRPGDTVTLYVSSGESLVEIPPSTDGSSPTKELNVDVLKELIKIRSLYHDTQEDPGERTVEHGVIYYRKDGNVTKIVCESGYDGWKYAREYYYDDGKLYYALVYNGTEEHRLYFSDGVLIRYIDSFGEIMDYGEIECPMEASVTAEAKKLSE